MQNNLLVIVNGMDDAQLFLILGISIFMIVCMWKVYEKAGKPGWAAIIPIYNIIVLLEIARKPWWYIFFFLIPFVNFIMSIVIHIEIAKGFGRGSGFGVGLALLGFIFFPILAFGSDVYIWGDNSNKIEDHLVE